MGGWHLQAEEDHEPRSGLGGGVVVLLLEKANGYRGVAVGYKVFHCMRAVVVAHMVSGQREKACGHNERTKTSHRSGHQHLEECTDLTLKGN